MSKKFGKFVLVTTALATAAAAAYYFSTKKKELCTGDDAESEEFDDFDKDLDAKTDNKAERSYVELNMDGTSSEKSETEEDKVSGSDMLAKAANKFSDLTNKISETAGRVVGRTIEKVEEFFDDEDVSDEKADDTEAAAKTEGSKELLNETTAEQAADDEDFDETDSEESSSDETEDSESADEDDEDKNTSSEDDTKNE